MNTPGFVVVVVVFTFIRIQGIIYIYPRLKKKVGLFSDTMNARSFKICMVTALLGIYIVTLGLIP